MIRNQLFNKMIEEQIQKESRMYKNIGIVHEDSDDDILKQQSPKRQAYTDRSRNTVNESFPSFKQSEIVLQLEGGETNRTDL